MILRLLRFTADLSNEPKGTTHSFLLSIKIPAGDNAPTTHYQPAAGIMLYKNTSYMLIQFVNLFYSKFSTKILSGSIRQKSAHGV